MLFKTVVVSGMLAAAHAASLKRSPIDTTMEPSQDFEELLRRDVNLMSTLTRRQKVTPSGTSPLTSVTPIAGDASDTNIAKWEEMTREACMATLQDFGGQTSNPSGLAICYNLPFLDTRTGVFQAELRFYNASAPVDPWVGVTTGDIGVTLSYLGATVQAMGAVNTTTKRHASVPEMTIREAHDGKIEARQTINTMTELKTLMYVGRINDNLLGPAMSQAALKPLLVPQIDLLAVNPISKATVTMTLSSADASFVNGFFSKVNEGPTNSDPNAAASASAAVVSAAPFIVPGTSLAFFPIGLVVTSLWALFFFLTVGLGTYGRIQYRDQYRSSVRAQSVRSVRTI